MGGALTDYVGVDQQLIRILPFVGGADTVVLRVQREKKMLGVFVLLSGLLINTCTGYSKLLRKLPKIIMHNISVTDSSLD